MCRQLKSADNDSTPVERSRRPPGVDHDVTTSPYQSLSSLSSTSDVEATSAVTWHTPGASPRPHDDLLVDPGTLDRSRDERPRDASNGKVMDAATWITHEMTSADVTASATEQTPATFTQSDLERHHGEYVCFCLL